MRIIFILALLAQRPSGSNTNMLEAELGFSSAGSWLCCPSFSHRMSPGLLWKGLRLDMPVSKRSRLRPHLRTVYLPHRVHGEAVWAEWVWERGTSRRCYFPSNSWRCEGRTHSFEAVPPDGWSPNSAVDFLPLPETPLPWDSCWLSLSSKFFFWGTDQRSG